jgi:hypothetical protein
MTFLPLCTLDSWSAKCGRNENLSEFPRGGWIDGEALVPGIPLQSLLKWDGGSIKFTPSEFKQKITNFSKETEPLPPVPRW